jgi:histidinol-phosphatase
VGKKCKRMRGWSDCYAHVLVATGRADAVVEAVMNPWDSAASIVVVEEAGGRYTGFNGVASAHEKDALITNGLIHDELLKLIDDSVIPY